MNCSCIDIKYVLVVQWHSKKFGHPLKIVLKLILDNAQYMTEHLTAAQLRVSKALYTKAIRAAVIN